jgi:isoleucyl-tRNA synthetase
MAKSNYKETLNLPRTDFPMKGRLTTMEPEMREHWEKIDLHGKIRAARKDAPKWILHDGPPYANGQVHIGTGQNKILKDFVIKYRTMKGFQSPFVPGWDCHGLPIEHKVLKDLGPKAKEMSKAEIRKLCLEFAWKHIDLQRDQFKSLGIFGDWENPYLTIDPGYELAILEVFELLWQKGHATRRRKAIHWCIHDRTALAEAELEYKKLPSPSIFMGFEMVDRPWDLLVWTTTPWTLPANVAVAVHPGIEYAVVKRGDRLAVVAPGRIEELRKKFDLGETVETITGKDLEGLQYKHPLFGHECPVVLADYVTVTEGTGLVHTAPGHGSDDYQTGLKYDLPILSPVDASGVFTEEAKQYENRQVFEANPIIVEDLRKSGVLLHDESFDHDYPCCWRCKQPVIFRATEQWFILIDHDDARQRALDAVKETKWFPKWGEIRISSMLRDRPDWCISRQRSWGVPIPSFHCEECEKVLITQETLDATKELFREGGADAWFTTPVEKILPENTRCACGSSRLRKEEDIFDVWFESAASHRAVSMRHPDLAFPADLYLEGTDQHRGWFQVSLLASLLSNGKAPFREVVTHGFCVDARTGNKLSKSGFLIPVDEVGKKIGMEILRLWIYSINFSDDLPISWEILKMRQDPYRKFRNTFRYMLGSLSDFDPARDRIPYKELRELDRWILGKLGKLIESTSKNFEEYRFYQGYQAVYEFCVVTLSSLYFDIIKDRLYTSGRTSPQRRSAQTAVHEILQAMVRLLAPVLVHTTEEVWKYIPGEQEAESVHLASWPEVPEERKDEELATKYETLLKVREEVNRALEKLRRDGRIGKSLEGHVTVYTSDEEMRKYLRTIDLREFFIVSEAIMGETPAGTESEQVKGLFVLAEKSGHPKCNRCWNLREDVGKHETHPDVCGSCLQVLQDNGEPAGKAS